MRYSIGFQFAAFLTVMSVFGILFFLAEDYKTFQPVSLKQYPDQGKAHYTFEPAK